MMLASLLLLLLLVLLSPVTAEGSQSRSTKGKVDTVVVLLEENRSLDHLLGFWRKKKQSSGGGFNGLTGNECLPRNATRGNSGPIEGGKKRQELLCVTDDAPYIAPMDPDHSLEGTSFNLYGAESGKAVFAGSDNLTFPQLLSPNQGFVQRATETSGIPDGAIRMFSPGRVPVTTALAESFAVFDRYFCSVPGPTHPNRMFAFSATSYGSTNNNVPPGGWPQKTIFDLLDEAGLDWRMYSYDAPWALMLKSLRSEKNKARIRPYSEYARDAREGKLKPFSFIEPRYYIDPVEAAPASDMHPSHSVAVGEMFVRNVYEELRASPQWNSSLLLYTFDEHGGFYDHVSPPAYGIPPPDNHHTQNGYGAPFDFKRLGLRVPMIAISPWIDAQVVPGAQDGPEGAAPTRTSEYEHSSIIATISALLGFEKEGRDLNARTRWAGRFDHLLSARETPRTDCPLKLPSLPIFGAEDPASAMRRESQQPLNELQSTFLDLIADLLHEPRPDASGMNEMEGGVYARKQVAKYLRWAEKS